MLPGPAPKQSAAAFAVRAEVVVDSVLAGSSRLVAAGDLLPLAAAAAASVGALLTVRAGRPALRLRPASRPA